MAEDEGIEPSTFRCAGFQDQLLPSNRILQYVSGEDTSVDLLFNYALCISFNTYAIVPKWSEWQDSNLRPLAPKASALSGCATLGCVIKRLTLANARSRLITTLFLQRCTSYLTPVTTVDYRAN